MKLATSLLFPAFLASTLAMPGAVALAQGTEELIPKAESAYRDGRLDDAESLLRKIIELNPEDAKAYYNLGLTLQNLKRYEEAIRSYEKAIELNPEDAAAYNNLGNTLDDLKRYEEAIRSYKKAIELNPEDALAYNNLGNTLADLKRYEEAIRIYEKAIELNPEYADAYYNLDNTLYNLKRYEEAIRSYEKAIELNPEYAKAYYNLGITLADLKRYEEAIRSYEKAIELNPEDAKAYNNLGRLYFERKGYEEAIRLYKLGLSSSPEVSTANVLRNNLEQAERELALQRGDTQQVSAATTSYLLTSDPIDRIKRSIVLIYAEASGKASGVIGKGTGFVIRRRGNKVWILTNRHVIQNPEDALPASRLNVEFYLGQLPTGKVGQRLIAEHVSERPDQQGSAPEQDLAVIVVDNAPKDVQPLVLAATMGSLDSVQTIGHPGNQLWRHRSLPVLDVDSEEIILRASMDYGGSGSPVLGQENQVVGVIYDTDSVGGRLMFVAAYSISQVRQALQRWRIETP